MKRNLLQALHRAFDAPAPRHKQEFLRKMNLSGCSKSQIFLGQAPYIRKWVWFLSVTILAASLLISPLTAQESLWKLSCLMPYLSVVFLEETVRSEIYGMSELEMATKFSLKSILLSRMSIIGITHLVLLLVIMLFTSAHNIFGMLQMGVYLLTPYLLVNTVGLWITRHFRPKEAAYGCLAAAVIISIIPAVSDYITSVLFNPEVFSWWIIAILFLIFTTIYELKKMIKRMEDLTWSF